MKRIWQIASYKTFDASCDRRFIWPYDDLYGDLDGDSYGDSSGDFSSDSYEDSYGHLTIRLAIHMRIHMTIHNMNFIWLFLLRFGFSYGVGHLDSVPPVRGLIHL